VYQRRNQGYIEQQIEAIALVLAKVLGLKAEREFPAAQVEIGKAFQNLSGLAVPTVLALPETMASMSFRSGNQLDAGRALAAGMLLEEHASVAMEQNRLGAANAALRRALELYAECILAEETLRTPEYEARIYGILSRLNDDDLTESTRARLKMPF
jgi:hypothetical protein